MSDRILSVKKETEGVMMNAAGPMKRSSTGRTGGEGPRVEEFRATGV